MDDWDQLMMIRQSEIGNNWQFWGCRGGGRGDLLERTATMATRSLIFMGNAGDGQFARCLRAVLGVKRRLQEMTWAAEKERVIEIRICLCL